MSWHCYIIECEDGSLYTGITQDLERRFERHKRQSGAKHTAKNEPLEIVWTEEYSTREAAGAREQEIKG